MKYVILGIISFILGFIIGKIYNENKIMKKIYSRVN
jgi:hypothetical protein